MLNPDEKYELARVTMGEALAKLMEHEEVLPMHAVVGLAGALRELGRPEEQIRGSLAEALLLNDEGKLDVEGARRSLEHAIALVSLPALSGTTGPRGSS